MKKNSAEDHLPREEYLQHRNVLTDMAAHTNDQYDKTILPVAGGALFLTMAFLKDIVKEPPYLNPELLIIGWTSLAVAILTSLLSLIASYHAFQHRIKQWDEEYNRQEPVKRKTGFWSIFTLVCNWISLCTVILGVCCIIWFAYIQITLGGPSHGNK